MNDISLESFSTINLRLKLYFTLYTNYKKWIGKIKTNKDEEKDAI